MGPCIIMLQHEMMVTWMNGKTMGLRISSRYLCVFKNAINKMHLCSLSITYACPYHNPAATMGHSIHNVDISKPVTHTTPDTLSALVDIPAGLTPDGDAPMMKTWTADGRPASQSIATQTSPLPSAAAAFFIRAAQKLSLSRRKKSPLAPGAPLVPGEAPGPLLYTGGFSGALQLSPPAVPPCLLRAGTKVKDTPGMGKVRVMVRICSVHSSESSESMSLLKVDSRKKLLTLCETSAAGQTSAAAQRRSSASAPKTFAFDAIFSQDASQAEVCSGALAEVIQSVVNGADGCIFCFGHANLGKTYTMIGRDCSTQSLGVAPTAISWLFKVIEERRQKAGARFSVGASAVEISGREETLADLLAEHQEAPGPALSLLEDPLCGSQLQNQTELRANTAEQAAFFLDVAVAARRSSQAPSDQEARRNSHFLFTLHLYQERLDKSNKAAISGRSRLHLLDLGSCETDVSRTREGGAAQCLSLSALGNVILALANGAKHVPYRDSKLAMLLSESLGNINCRTTMIAHVSDSLASYMETLTTVQLAARIHRTRKNKSKNASSSSGGESSCEEGPPHRPPHLRPFHPRTVALDPDTPLLLSSDPEYSSSSEHSCDTVIYIGPGGMAISDRELSDNEGPPSSVPIIPSLNKKQVKDAPRSDRDRLKCNTFAELQERLDCIDGSEGPATFGTEAKAAQATALRTQTGVGKPTEATSPPKSVEIYLHGFVERRSTTCTNKPDQDRKFPSAGSVVDTSKRTSADGEKLLTTHFQPCVVKQGGTSSEDSEPVVREKVYFRGGVPKPSASPSIPRTSRAASQPRDVVGRTLPVGMSQPLGSPNMERAYNLRAALLGSCLDRDFLRTTVTLQQPVELNGEDELVFTVVEELPHGLVPDNGRPSNSNLLSFNREVLPSGSRPVSIISSINDEYDAYTCRQGAVGPEVGTESQKGLFCQHGDKQSTVGSRASEVSADSAERDGTHSRRRLYLQDKTKASEDASVPGLFHKQPLYDIKSSLNDSPVCFSELGSDPALPNKPSFTLSGTETPRMSTCRPGAVGPLGRVGTDSQEVLFSQHGDKQSTVGLLSSKVSADLSEREGTCSTNKLNLRDKILDTSMLSSPSLFHKQPFLQHGIKSSLNDSGVCFSELDSDPATPNKTYFKCPPSPSPSPSPDSTKAFLKGSPKVRANTLNNSVSAQIPHHAAHSSLPRKNKPTSCAPVGCRRQEGRHDGFLLQGSSEFDPREVEFLSAGKPPRSGMSSVSSKRPGGNSNSVPRPPKAQMSSSAQRVVDGCEKSNSRRGDTLIKLPRLTRGATTLGTVSAPQSFESKWFHDGTSVTGTLRFSSLGKKSNGQKSSSVISKSGSGNISPPAPAVRQSSQEQKTRTALSPSAFKTSSDTGRFSFPRTSTSEEEFNIRLQADSISHRTASLKTDPARTSSSLKTRGAKAESSRYSGSLMSLERYDSQTLAGSKPELSSRSNRSVPRLGSPAYTSTYASSSEVSLGVFATTSKLGPVKGNNSSSRAAVSAGSKVRTLSTSGSKSLISPKPLDNTTGQNTSLPPTCKSTARSGTGAKTGRGTVMGTKQAISRVVNSRVSELATSQKLNRRAGVTGSDGTDSGTSSVSGSPINTQLPSPYSKITAPRRPQRYSSGHGSDNSSILSGELPPAMGRTALFYHSGGSSGYESMIRDSETTGSTSSAHDSMSESRASSSNRSRVSKSPKKRGNGGFLRRRLIPAPLPDRKWAELPSLGGALKEPFEIKVYEIDDVERLQTGREEAAGSEPFQDVEKGLQYFNVRLRMLEKRQQQIRELQRKHEQLKVELDEAKSRLMLHSDKWSGDFDVDPALDRESQDYLEALVQATAELQDCVDLCKSRVMMETCFDIAVTPASANAAAQRGRPEIEV
ncbi:kinesin-like protein KIF26A [Sander vitreus]